jgi:lysophospholipase L1-like esterase
MRWTVPLLLTAALLTTACDDGGGSHAPRTIKSYVALGDSYTAGAGIGTPAAGAAPGCGQTTASYPRLVAAKLGATLADASCGGATTGNAYVGQTLTDGEVWPAQLNRLDKGTDLVTVSFGYNDLGFFGIALATCASPAAGSGSSDGCGDRGPDTNVDVSLLADEIGASLERVLEQVDQRAPDAEVLVVGYPQPVPAQGSCAELSVIDGAYDEAREHLELLDDAMRKAADQADATFVDVFGASKGHDVCAGDQAYRARDGSHAVAADRAGGPPAGRLRLWCGRLLNRRPVRRDG